MIAGCDTGRKGASGSSIVAPSGAVGGGVAVNGPSPRDAADSLLKSIGDGKLTPEQLTPYFRSVIAAFPTNEEKKAGHADVAARRWLEGFAGTKFVFLEQIAFDDKIVERGRAEAPDGKAAFTLRLVKDGAAFKIDWLHRSDRMETLVLSPPDKDLYPGQDVVRNFLDILLGGDVRQAHALMSAAWKKSLAPPTPADVRKGLDYDPGFLTQTTRSWKIGDYLGYKLPKAELAADKAAATFTAELDAGATKTLYTVLVVKDKVSGQWIIESFGK